MQVKRQQLELDMEQLTSSKLGREYIKTAYCHPVYLTYMKNTSHEMAGWMKHKLDCACQDSRFRIARRNTKNISYADDITEGERGE